MESKHKNALIGALLAVVFVMAVGYAAFAQQLTINGTATIDSKWDIHFDDANHSVSPVAGNLSTGTASTSTPSGTITYDSDKQIATISATLIQPGDTVTYVLKPKNFGENLNAKGTMTVNGTDGATCSGNTCTKGYIQFEVTPQLSNSLAPGSSDTITIVATYTEPDTNATDTVRNTAGITVGLSYVQV